MERSHLTVFVIALVGFLPPGGQSPKASGGGGDPAPAHAPGPAAGKDENRFALDLFRKVVAADEASNVFLSPESVRGALEMAFLAARGKTAEQLRSVLGPARSDSRAKASGGSAAKLANAVWVPDTLKLKPEFARDVAAKAGATIFIEESPADPEGSAKAINEWASRETGGMITQVLDASDLKGTDGFVLTNAIAFKARWEAPFDPKSTSAQPFAVGPKRSVDVKMMQAQRKLRCIVKDDLQVVILPYADGGGSLVLALGGKSDGRAEPVTPDSRTFASWLTTAGLHNVRLVLPKFAFSDATDLRETLVALGLDRPFSPEADFSGMSDGKSRLDKVKHVAAIKLDEEGTEAAAVTAATGVRFRPKRIDIRFDRPFSFFVIEDGSNRVIFAGRMVDPSTMNQ